MSLSIHKRHHTHTHREREREREREKEYCFHMELVYIVSRGNLTVMFVNTPRAYKRPNISLRLEKNFDARRVGRVLILGSYR